MIEIYKINFQTHFLIDGMFTSSPEIYSKYNGYVCESCGGLLFTTYVYLIEELKKAQLIAEDYPLLCCDCKFKERVRRQTPTP